jgi:hypothetical protein
MPRVQRCRADESDYFFLSLGENSGRKKSGMVIVSGQEIQSSMVNRPRTMEKLGAISRVRSNDNKGDPASQPFAALKRFGGEVILCMRARQRRSLSKEYLGDRGRQ